jgi:hypothetical protein
MGRDDIPDRKSLFFDWYFAKLYVHVTKNPLQTGAGVAIPTRQSLFEQAQRGSHAIVHPGALRRWLTAVDKLMLGNCRTTLMLTPAHNEQMHPSP